jgi:hypothetical protein
LRLPIPAELPVPKPGPKTEERAETADQEHIVPFGRMARIMVGATIVIVVALALWSALAPETQNNFSSYRDRMARLVQRSYPMKIMLTDQSQIRDYFRTNGGLYDFPVPRNLEKLPGKGAAVFTWHSQPVSLFGMEAGANTNLYLFVIRNSIFQNPNVSTNKQYVRVGQLMTASWETNNVIYILTGPNDETAMRSFSE